MLILYGLFHWNYFIFLSKRSDPTKRLKERIKRLHHKKEIIIDIQDPFQSNHFEILRNEDIKDKIIFIKITSFTILECENRHDNEFLVKNRINIQG